MSRHSSKPIEVAKGDRYGLLTVLEEAPRQRRTGGVAVRAFVVRCDCGTTKTVRLTSLREGSTVSCGCFHRQRAAEIASSRGTHRQSKTHLHYIWLAMKARCHNPKDKSYPRYGARGIEVCQEWRDSYEAFAAYVGERPEGMTLDRIVSTGNYEPGNVRWADYTQQARNTRRNIRVSREGEVMTLAEAAERFGIPYDRARYQLNTKGTYGEFTRVSS